ncbi:hypothetical protein ACFFRR_009620 [Megaselia abdita]
MRFHILAFCFVFGLSNAITETCQKGEIKGLPFRNCSDVFLVCCENEWISEKCPDGLLFDKNKGFCVTTCQTCTSGEIISASNELCNKIFQVCCDGEWKEEVCPLDLVFDPENLYCKEKPVECEPTVTTTTSTITTTKKQANCDNFLPGAFKGVSNSSCESKFLVCCDGEWKEEVCPLDLIFDPELLYCTEKPVECEPTVTTESTTITTEDLSCDPSHPEGSFRPAQNCTQFEVCYTGKWIIQSCPPGMRFDDNLFCTPDSGECIPSTESTIATTTKQANCDNLLPGAFKGVSNSSCESKFLVCCDGEWKEEVCPLDLVFDTENLYCKEKPVECEPTVTTTTSAITTTIKQANCDHFLPGAFKGVSNSSCESKFLVCCDGEWKEEVCPLDLVFDPELLYCKEKPVECEPTVTTESTTITTEDLSCGPSHPEGSFRPAQNCIQFEVCYARKWIIQSCPPGMRFDDNLFCTPDNGECIPLTESTIATTTKQANCDNFLPGAFKGVSNSSCESKFLVCCDGEWKEEVCPLDLVFDPELLYCIEKPVECEPTVTTESTTITTKNLSCDPSHPEGSFRSAQNCTQFEVCYAGKWIIQSCPPGMRFDDNLFCTPDNGECIPLTESTIATTTKQSNCDNFLPGAFKGVSNSSCESKFLVCCDGEWKEEVCPLDLVFDPELLYCIEKPVECEPTVTTESTTITTKDLSCDPSHPEGSFRSAQNCTQFEVCYAGKWIIQSCPPGMRFDDNLFCTPDNGECIPSTESTIATTTKQANCDNFLPGAFKGVSNSSCESKFLVCCDGEWKEEVCPLGLVFDPELLYCKEKPMECEPTVTTTTSTITTTIKQANCDNFLPGAFKGVSNSSCESKFLVCCDGEWKEEVCPLDLVFDPELLYCIEKSVECEPTVTTESTTITTEDLSCDPSHPEGSFRPAQNCTQFEVCYARKWIIQSCPPGMRFDDNLFCTPDNGECIPLTESTIATTTKQSNCDNFLPGAFKEASNSSCESKFLVCCDGEWKEEVCPLDLVFDPQLSYCKEKPVECEPPITCLPGTLKPASFSSCDNEFYICCDGVWQKDLCPLDMVFNATLLYCINKSPQCNYQTNCTSGTFKAISDSKCSQDFLVCCNNSWETETCPQNLIFSQSKHYCVLPIECESCISGTFRPILEDCTRFEVCSNNQWIEQSCPPNQIFKESICVIDDGSCNSCANVSPGTFLPSPQSCSEFRICCDGYEQLQSCPPNLYFDTTLGFCSLNATCNSANHCALSDEGRFEAIPSSQNMFKVCVNGLWIVQNCPDGLIFDESILICKKKGICETGTFLSDSYSINQFYVCIDGDFVHQICPENMAFNKETLICSIEGKEGSLQPSNLSHTNFFAFYNKQWTIKSCPFKYNFDETKLICIPSDLNENCSEPTGFIRRHNTCGSFNVCIGGKIEKRSCNPGMKFDYNLKRCVKGDC